MTTYCFQKEVILSNEELHKIILYMEKNQQPLSEFESIDQMLQKFLSRVLESGIGNITR